MHANYVEDITQVYGNKEASGEHSYSWSHSICANETQKTTVFSVSEIYFYSTVLWSLF